MPRKAGEPNDRGMRATELIAEDEAHLRATRAARRKDIESIRRLKGQRMSHRRLIEIYGRDAVDMALTSEC